MTNANTNTTSSVAAALKAAKAQQAAQDGQPVDTTNATVPGAANTQPGTRPTRRGRAAKPPVQKEPKVKVDDAWMAVLTEKVNTKFADLLADPQNPWAKEHGTASINFAVAKNKGIPVSLTPRINYEDGGIQSPGPKGRLGFCTDQKFDEWFSKVEEKLKSAMERKPRLKGKAPAKSSFWADIAENLRTKLGEAYSVRSTGGRLTIHEAPEDKTIPAADWPLKAAFKQDGEKVILSSAKGSVQTITDLLNAVMSTMSESETVDETPENETVNETATESGDSEEA